MPRKFAQGTSVPVAKSKGEIDKLLKNWGCDRISWEEDLRDGFISLRFVWTREGHSYAARLSLSVPTEASIRSGPMAKDGRTGKVNENKVRDLLERTGREEMRLLLLWLKAAFHAVEAGILDPRVVFLPFFVNEKDETVADVIIPRLEGGSFFKQLKA